MKGLDIKSIAKHYCSWRVLKRVFASALIFAGAIEVALSLASLFKLYLPFIVEGSPGLTLLMVIGLVYGIYNHRPIDGFDHFDSTCDLNISLKEGDVLNESGNLVVGMSDCFDTKVGDVISKDSLQAHLVDRLYAGDSWQFEKDVRKALGRLSVNPQRDNTKTKGNKNRYPIGTTIVLRRNSQRIFAVAYSRMGSDLMAHSEIDDMWKSLAVLWSTVRVAGDMKPVTIPVIGTGHARVKGVINKYQVMIKIILLSYVLLARAQPISKKLTIVVSPRDVDKVNYYDLREFVRNL